MKIRRLGLSALVGVVLCALLPGASAQESSSSESRSVWDGVYTPDQAKRGQTAYENGCSSCHGDALKGAGEAPALSGAPFLSNWGGLPLGDLYERIRRSMPQDDPTRVTRQQKIDIVAYILSFNRFPSGKVELPRQPELLKLIRFEATKPDSRK